MIETPVKPPPPDPRTRVMDPPPDTSARHDRACRHCGSPLLEDQAACLVCGAMVEDGGARIGVRRAALGSVTALLVLGGAVCAAVAGLPHGKHVGKAPIAQVFGKKKIPPATAEPGSGSGSGSGAPGSTTPLPGAGASSGAAPPTLKGSPVPHHA